MVHRLTSLARSEKLMLSISGDLEASRRCAAFARLPAAVVACLLLVCSSFNYPSVLTLTREGEASGRARPQS